MNTPLPLDEAALDALNVYSGSISDASLLNGHYTFGQVRALVRQSRAALTLAARVAEQDAEALRYYAADGSFVVMESREAVVAARIAAAKRVAELESECARLSECVAAERMNAITHASHANALRDALEKQPCRCERIALLAGNTRAACIRCTALAATPAADLAAHDAGVLERAIKAIEAPEGECEGLADCESNFGDAYSSGFDDGLRSARNSVRALAAQAQEVKP